MGYDINQKITVKHKDTKILESAIKFIKDKHLRFGYAEEIKFDPVKATILIIATANSNYAGPEVEKLVKKFPELMVTLDYKVPECEAKGKVKWENGKIIEEKHQ